MPKPQNKYQYDHPNRGQALPSMFGQAIVRPMPPHVLANYMKLQAGRGLPPGIQPPSGPPVLPPRQLPPQVAAATRLGPSPAMKAPRPTIQPPSGPPILPPKQLPPEASIATRLARLGPPPAMKSPRPTIQPPSGPPILPPRQLPPQAAAATRRLPVGGSGVAPMPASRMVPLPNQEPTPRPLPPGVYQSIVNRQQQAAADRLRASKPTPRPLPPGVYQSIVNSRSPAPTPSPIPAEKPAAALKKPEAFSFPEQLPAAPAFGKRRGIHGKLPAPKPGMRNSSPALRKAYSDAVEENKDAADRAYASAFLSSSHDQKGKGIIRGQAALGFRENTSKIRKADQQMRGSVFDQYKNDEYEYMMKLYKNRSFRKQAIHDAKIERTRTAHGASFSPALTSVGTDMLEMFKGYLFSDGGLRYLQETTAPMGELEMFRNDPKTAMIMRVVDILNRVGPYTGFKPNQQKVRGKLGQKEGDDFHAVWTQAAEAITQANKYFRADRDGMIDSQEWSQVPEHTRAMIQNLSLMYDQLYAAIGGQ